MNSPGSRMSRCHSTRWRSQAMRWSSGVGPLPAFLVFPVRRDAFFGDAVHLLGADLHFERDARCGPTTEVCSDWYRLGRGIAMKSLMRPGIGCHLLWITPSAA